MATKKSGGFQSMDWRSAFEGVANVIEGGGGKVGGGGVRKVKELGARLHWVVQVTEHGAIESVRAGVSVCVGGVWEEMRVLNLGAIRQAGGRYIFDEERDRRGWDRLSKQAMLPGAELSVATFLPYIVGSERVHSLDALGRMFKVQRVKPQLRGYYTPNSLVLYAYPGLRTRDARVLAKEPVYPRGTIQQREEAKRLLHTTLDVVSGELWELTEEQVGALAKMPALVRVPLADEGAFFEWVREAVPFFDVQLPVRDKLLVSRETVFEVEMAPVGEELRVRVFTWVDFGGGKGKRLDVGVAPARLLSEGSEKGTVVEVIRELEREVADLGVLVGDVGLSELAAGDVAQWTLKLGGENVAGVLEVVHGLEGHRMVRGVIWPRDEKLRVRKAGVPQLRLEVERDKKTNWFGVEGELSLDDGVAVDLLKLSNLKTPYVRLGEGDYVLLDQFLMERLKKLDDVGVVDVKAGVVAVPELLVGEVEDVLNAAGAFVPVRGNQLEVLKQEEGVVREVPEGLGAELRPYQEEGYRWLESRARAGMGAVLADDMGLGKTIQTIAMLLSYSRRSVKASLVVVPASLLDNWKKELGAFAAGLRVRVLTSVRGGDLEGLGEGWVVVASYNLVAIHASAFKGVDWGVVVMDEAQNLKNPTTKRSAAVRDLGGEFRLALSGTPVENNLVELWSLFQQVNPSLLGPFATYSERFMRPIEAGGNVGALKVLQRVIRPFLLRRTKTGVLTELPELIEINHEVEPGAQERAVLEALASDARKELRAGSASGKPALFATLVHLMRMRRAACDPRLVGGEMVGAKVEELVRLMGLLKANGHRALVFSQFTDFLKLIEGHLREGGFSSLYLDGQTPVKERGALVEEFQTGDADAFLISLKAGGAGLNITAADYVIIADPWWNPAVEDQATARAHRMGQKKAVTVYRLVNMASVEPKVLLLHERKRELANSLLSVEGEDAMGLSKLNAEDLLDALGL